MITRRVLFCFHFFCCSLVVLFSLHSPFFNRTFVLSFHISPQSSSSLLRAVWATRTGNYAGGMERERESGNAKESIFLRRWRKKINGERNKREINHVTSIVSTTIAGTGSSSRRFMGEWSDVLKSWRWKRERKVRWEMRWVVRYPKN